MHKIKINLTDDNVREYELQVGSQQYPESNVSLKDLTNVHAKMRKVFTDNIYLDLIHPNNTMNIDYTDLSVFLYHSTSLAGAETSKTSYDDYETIKVYASGIFMPIPNTYVIYGFKISNNFYSQTGFVEMMLDRDGLMTNILIRDHEAVDGGPCVTWDPPRALN